jgi:pyruvate,water dikinase
MARRNYIKFFKFLNNKDVSIAGGKNASLGEMYQKLKKYKIKVPNGFATTSQAYWDFLKENNLNNEIKTHITQFRKKKVSLEITGKKIRDLILSAKFSDEMIEQLENAYKELCRFYKKNNVDVAVRSSATAEDLPNASFAGQQESYLNVKGKKQLIDCCLRCYASLFTNRAITYREEKKFDHMKVALSIGIQKMVRSDKAGAGVMFTLDTESGFREVVEINAVFGLGENIVQGTVIPDEYIVFKPLIGKKGIIPIIEKTLGKKEKKMIYTNTNKKVKNCITPEKERNKFVLNDKEILTLAKWACQIEKHYKKPMDIEWAKDGETNELFIVQARPETVESQKQSCIFNNFSLLEKGKLILKGLAVGGSISTGKVQVIKNIKEINKFQKGSILVTQTTAPDWVPIMKEAAGIITDHGGRTSHAAIVSRELNVPAIVGTNNATSLLKDGQMITISCAEGDEGYVYQGNLKFKTTKVNIDKIPKISTKIMINISSPSSAFRWWQLPCKGIGLARMEFIVNNIIKIHPMALAHFSKVKDIKIKKIIEKLTQGYPSKEAYFIDLLSRSIAKIAAAQYPNPVIVRMSDFKSNEYAELIGGDQFEIKEDNPMLGFRGASRYYSDHYKDGFSLECKAMKIVREKLGLDNVIIMIPFCRTIEEADKVLEVLEKNGLKRGKNGLKVYVMCEIPSNVILADKFAKRFDGFSIGSNDLTQLVLGVDRDSEELAFLFDANNEAVKKMIQTLIPIAHKNNCKVGICGQAPSDYPDFAKFLIDEGIDSISLNPDSVINIIKHIARFERKK